MTSIRTVRPATLLWWLVGLFGVTTLATYLYAHDPHEAGHYPTCILLRLTGLYCPGCGGTRAAYDLMHGDLAGSMRENALVLPLAVLVVLLGVRAVRRWRRGNDDDPIVPTGLAIGVAVVMLTFGVLRNLPGMELCQPL
jgi:hypothetical protein